MEDAYAAVGDWLFRDVCESRSGINKTNDQFDDVLRKVLSARVTADVGEVMNQLGHISNIAEERQKQPLLNWPWLRDSEGIAGHDQIYSTMANVLQMTKSNTMYVFGNELQLQHCAERAQTRFFLAKNEAYAKVALGSYFEKWYNVGIEKRLTLARLYARDMDSECSADEKTHIDSLNARYSVVPPEVAVVCAIVSDKSSVIRFVLSNILSMSFLTAVSLSRGASVSRCNPQVISLCTSLSTDYLGGQIAIVAAVFSRLMFPITEISDGNKMLTAGVSQIDHVAFTKNLYWLSELRSKDKACDRSRPKVRRYKISAVGNALFCRDYFRTLRWITTSSSVISIIVISVMFQNVGWAEKLEKGLNLLFTVLIPTVIGYASIDKEQNLLQNVMLGRRRISDVSDFPEQLFCDVIAFLEQEPANGTPRVNFGRFISAEHATWVSEYIRGETRLGRPVLLSELHTRGLSVSSRLELCIAEPGSLRNLVIDSNGTCKVGGRAAETGIGWIYLTCPMRLG